MNPIELFVGPQRTANSARMNIHQAAAQGYEVSADSYERGRPEYPSEAVQHLVGALGIREGTAVLDLGAGTGKFTKLLACSGAHLLAVEPVKAMRDKLVEKVPSATVLDGTAEAIPLKSSSLDAVVVAQAFHWFDGTRPRGNWACAEAGRTPWIGVEYPRRIRGLGESVDQARRPPRGQRTAIPDEPLATCARPE